MRALLLAFVALAGCAKPDPYVDLYRSLHPSIVFLSMRVPSDDPKRRGALDDAFGTAFVVESGDWGVRILTAKHVIDDARDLKATFGDRSHASDVRIVAVDAKTDLALLEVRSVKNITAVPLGESRSVVPGEAVGLLGYPIPDAFKDEGLGTTASIYAGHVASIRDPGGPNEAVELDVPIIPGESGGPVFGTDGKVIGLAESRFEEEHAIGFATPIDVIKTFLSAHAR
ncbi:MAG: trypsin-like peptidase domain-containing protein [Candidatus Eremiobacteraeota bacterium]|nr:trypsin-like peptidase domain-containing protein [Candidatus Eremiobacteraeota bacterium]